MNITAIDDCARRTLPFSICKYTTRSRLHLVFCQILLSFNIDIFTRPSIKWSAYLRFLTGLSSLGNTVCFTNQLRKSQKAICDIATTATVFAFVRVKGLSENLGCCTYKLQQEVTGKWFFSTGTTDAEIAAESSFRPHLQGNLLSTQSHRVLPPAMAVSVLLQFRQVHSLGGWCAPDSSHTHP